MSNSFDDGRTPAPGEYSLGASGLGLSATSWSGQLGGTCDGASANLEAYIAAPANLKDHLEMQLGLATAGTADRLTGQVLIDLIDENGYFTGSLDEIAARSTPRWNRPNASSASSKGSILPASAPAISPNASPSNCVSAIGSTRPC